MSFFQKCSLEVLLTCFLTGDIISTDIEAPADTRDVDNNTERGGALGQAGSGMAIYEVDECSRKTLTESATTTTRTETPITTGSRMLPTTAAKILLQRRQS